MKLKKQFVEFYKEIKIDEEVEDLKKGREVLQKDIENKLPDELKKHGIDLKKSEIKIFDQGSYILNTTISNDYGSIDRDVAVMFPLNIVENPDPRKIKAYVRDALKHQNRALDIKEPCVNVSYVKNGKEWMHIDLPVYAQYDGKVYLARGSEFATKGNYLWEDADPEGLNKWLLGKITGNAQLRRNIRYLKKWKQEKYQDSSLDHEIPPSIGLTLLMCKHFVPSTGSEGDDDLLSLRMSIQNIIDEFDLICDYSGNVIKADITYELPVIPSTDVFSKMKKSDSYIIKFYNRLNTALQNLTDACNVESEHDAGLRVQKVFGEKFLVPPKQVSISTSSNRREHSFG